MNYVGSPLKTSHSAPEKQKRKITITIFNKHNKRYQELAQTFSQLRYFYLLKIIKPRLIKKT